MYSPFDVEEDMDTSKSPNQSSNGIPAQVQANTQQTTANMNYANTYPYTYYNNQYNTGYATNGYNYQTFVILKDFGFYFNFYLQSLSQPQYQAPVARAPAWTPGMIPASIYQANPTPQQVQYHSVNISQAHTLSAPAPTLEQYQQYQQLQQLHQQLQFQAAYSSYVPTPSIDQQKKKISFNIQAQKDVKRTTIQLPTLHPSAGTSLETVHLESTPKPAPPPVTPKTRDGEFPPALKELVQKAFAEV